MGCQSLIKERRQQQSTLESHPKFMTLFWSLLVIFAPEQPEIPALAAPCCDLQQVLSSGSWLTHCLHAKAQSWMQDAGCRMQDAGCRMQDAMQHSQQEPVLSWEHWAHGRQPQQARQEKSEVWCWATGLCKEHRDKRSSTLESTLCESPWSYKKKED